MDGGEGEGVDWEVVEKVTPEQRRLWKIDWQRFYEAGWIRPSRPRVTMKEVKEIRELLKTGRSMRHVAWLVRRDEKTVRRYANGR